MESQMASLNSLSISREAMEALACCDSARLEGIAIRSQWLVDGGNLGLDRKESDSQIANLAELKSLGRLLELTNENLRVIRRSAQVRSVQLAYAGTFEREDAYR